MAIVSIAVLYLGVDFLKGTDFLASNNYYFTRFNDVGGLNIGNPVMVNGFAVGKVDAIYFEAHEKGNLTVKMAVAKRVPVTEGTQAFLGSTDLLGGKMIGLRLPQGETEELANKSFLPSFIEADLMSQLGDKASPIFKDLDTTFGLINQTLRDFTHTQKKLNATLDQFSQSAATLNGLLADNRASVAASANNIKQLTSNFIQTEKKLGELASSLNNVADTLEKAKLGQTIQQANVAMANLNKTLAGIERGEGTMGKLMKNDSLYNKMNSATQSLDELLINFREQPKRYVNFSVFGRKDKEKK